MTLEQLAHEAIALTDARPRAILGIAGAPGAGKSTLTHDLLEAVARRRGPEWVAHLPMDGYHLADVQLDRLGLRDVKGAPQTFDVDGYASALQRVRRQEPDVYVPGFERDLEQPIAAALVVPAEAQLIITEGNYLLLDEPRWHHVHRQLDAVWFVTGDESVRHERLLQRHVCFGKSATEAAEWVRRSDDVNALLVASTRVRADRVVVNSSAGWTFA